MTKEDISGWFKELQGNICEALENTDGKGRFISDLWERPGGGGGDSRVLEAGNIIEKGGVNFSAVHGETPDKILKSFQLAQADFFATGVSIVIHPSNPFVPIIHMNVRYFEMSNGVKWFGGGIDLTPHYVDESDARYFHTELKKVCDNHYPSYYPEFKEWADNYFFIKHRNETRGIGGIFFDRLAASEQFSLEDRFNFVKDIGQLFAPVYTHLMKKNFVKAYTEKEKIWQMIRRSRYVEFNLIYDSGTKFGLETSGRTESILMSMPPQASWFYNADAKAGQEEKKTLSLLKKGISWVK
ncbi:MAG TPA: oxygen-dependent coproporphyrinogen oxidase [Cytophagales bacterium]|nr:oxygen-dependent coproporphyrinogen oxidase [Cytophagales bacterium]